MSIYVIAPNDKVLVEQVMSVNPLTGEVWADDRVTKLKSDIKKHYIAQQGKKCAYCQVNLHTNHGRVWDTEHIICRNSNPEWTFEAANLCTSCLDCNQAKGKRSVTKSTTYKKFPKMSRNYTIVHPHFDTYDEHISVLIPGATYVYKSDKGRKTIEVCGLLRYHEQGGRQDIDSILRMSLRLAAETQNDEDLQTVVDYIAKYKKIRAQE